MNKPTERGKRQSALTDTIQDRSLNSMATDNPTKICIRCKTEKPLDCFHKNRQTKDGIHYYCNDCVKATTDHEKARQRAKRWYEENKDHVKQRDKAKRQQNNEKRRAYANKNREKIRAYNRAWAARNREKTRAWAREQGRRNADKVLARVVAWQKANPIRTKQNKIKAKHLRRARLEAAITGPINLEAIMERDKMICHICKKKVTMETLSFDHLIPVSKGGSHTESNLAVAHRRCNSKRGAGRLPAQLILSLDLEGFRHI